MPEKKTTAAKKTAATKKTTAKKTTAAATRARAADASATTAVAAPKARPVAKRTSVRKRAAATISSTAPTAAETVSGWRRFRRKTKVGVVVSAKQPKTAVVVVERMRSHPLYKKVIRVRKKFAAHDDTGDVREGDLVRIQESRPYSATKRWRVVEVLSRVGEAGAAAPRVADVSRQLEEAEGIQELVARQRADEEDKATEEGEQ